MLATRYTESMETDTLPRFTIEHDDPALDGEVLLSMESYYLKDDTGTVIIRRQGVEISGSVETVDGLFQPHVTNRAHDTGRFAPTSPFGDRPAGWVVWTGKRWQHVSEWHARLLDLLVAYAAVAGWHPASIDGRFLNQPWMPKDEGAL